MSNEPIATGTVTIEIGQYHEGFESTATILTTPCDVLPFIKEAASTMLLTYAKNSPDGFEAAIESVVKDALRTRITSVVQLDTLEGDQS